ncbi:uncharacterized protein B0T23DRAFT_224065 [Neurospora hispaniola]|uniref:Uncharacterized protein n=1 Tax=Neurospora hispaniola TaxID=588809 RepID=A0AAJ0I2K4_9PEZI|nr:hypothetical protein B0T23DRAFT_224065 [Neurospora hispaniola]
MSSSPGPYKLVTVNTAPDRAKRLIGRVVEDVKDKYTIIHVGNAASIEEVKSVVEEHRPNILVWRPLVRILKQRREYTKIANTKLQFTASMWTPEEAHQIITIAKEVVGEDLKTFSLPQGLQVNKGPDTVVEYIKENLPSLLG